MITLGLVLAAVGVGDLVASDLAGHPVQRPVHGILATAAFAIAAAVVTGLPPLGLVLVPAVATAGASGWIVARDGGDLGIVRAWGALAVLAATTGAALVTGFWLRSVDLADTVLFRAIGTLGIPLLDDTPPDALLLAAGVTLALLATANAVVRLVLVVAGPEVARSESRLRGGRLIGPLERLLIFGLGAAGELTAAAVIVAAKSLLRFPELSTLARGSRATGVGTTKEGGTALDGVDAVTEYFLIGSLVSWALALGPLVLLR